MISARVLRPQVVVAVVEAVQASCCLTSPAALSAYPVLARPDRSRCHLLAGISRVLVDRAAGLGLAMGRGPVAA